MISSARVGDRAFEAAEGLVVRVLSTMLPRCFWRLSCFKAHRE